MILNTPVIAFCVRYVRVALFAHGTSFGAHLCKNDSFSISVLGRWRFQQLDLSTDSIFAGLERRHQTLDAGITSTYKGRFGSVTLDWVTNTLNKHNGQEVQLSYRYDYTRGAWTFSPFITWGLQDENLANYYFGVSEWSWRANYGYQAQENTIGAIDQGQIEKSNVADTNIAGIMLSRLLSDTSNVDFLGRFAMYRHFEDGVRTTDGLFTSDNDFWS